MRRQPDGASAAIALGAVLVVAALTRLAGLDDRLLHDEGYSWLVGSSPSPGAFLHRLAAFENTPPLYYLLLAPLPLNDEPWIRLPAMLAGMALVAVLYAIARPALGRRAALLAAGALAVAPYEVANSNFARGFMLADLGLALALWALVRLASGAQRSWWALYLAGAVIALYSEYDAAITLAALAAGFVTLAGPGRRRQAAALSAVPVLAIVPWIHQLVRSLEALHHTKVGGTYTRVTPGVLRDQVVPLVFGENGQHAGAAVRTLLFAILAAGLAIGFTVCRRHGPAARPLLILVSWAAAGTLLGHMLAPALGAGIFNVRYLTFEIPLACLVLAAAAAAIPGRIMPALLAVALVAIGAGLAVKRSGGNGEPDPAAVSRLLRGAGARTVLTNSAVMAYYLRDQGVILDRPLNFGPDLAKRDCVRCPRPLAVVDDRSVGNGARPGPGRAASVGQYLVRVVP